MPVFLLRIIYLHNGPTLKYSADCSAFCPGIPDSINPHPKADCGFQAEKISPRL